MWRNAWRNALILAISLILAFVLGVMCARADTAVFRVLGSNNISEVDWITLSAEAQSILPCGGEYPWGWAYPAEPWTSKLGVEAGKIVWVRTCPEVMAIIRADLRFEWVEDVVEE